MEVTTSQKRAAVKRLETDRELARNGRGFFGGKTDEETVEAALKYARKLKDELITSHVAASAKLKAAKAKLALIPDSKTLAAKDEKITTLKAEIALAKSKQRTVKAAAPTAKAQVTRPTAKPQTAAAFARTEAPLPMSLKEFNSMTPIDRMRFVKQGGKLV